MSSMKSRRRARFYALRRNYRSAWRELEHNQWLAMRMNGWIHDGLDLKATAKN